MIGLSREISEEGTGLVNVVKGIIGGRVTGVMTVGNGVYQRNTAC